MEPGMQPGMQPGMMQPGVMQQPLMGGAMPQNIVQAEDAAEASNQYESLAAGWATCCVLGHCVAGVVGFFLMPDHLDPNDPLADASAAIWASNIIALLGLCHSRRQFHKLSFVRVARPGQK